MSYVLTNSNGNQLDILKNTLKGWKEEPNDLLVLTEDGGKIFTSKRVLSLHSSMFREICKDLPTQTAVTVPISSRCLENLISLIIDGVAQTIDIDPVLKAASVLGINIGNVEVGLVEDNLENHNNRDMNDEYVMENISRNLVVPTEPPPAYATPQIAGFQCRFCPMRFRHEEELNNHTRIHMQPTRPIERQPPSNNLPEAYTNNISTISGGFPVPVVKTEMVEPSDSLGYPCPECAKSYSSTEGLRRHRITHTAEDGKPFVCLVCGKRYSRKDKLSVHMKNIHNQYMNGPRNDDSKERFPCDQCDKTFSRKDILQRHARNIHLPMLGHLSFSDLETF